MQGTVLEDLKSICQKKKQRRYEGSFRSTYKSDSDASYETVGARRNAFNERKEKNHLESVRGVQKGSLDLDYTR